MTRKAMLLHVTLCLAALVFAWRAATRVEEKKGGPTSTTLLPAASGEVARVDYQWDKGHNVVVSKGAGPARAATIAIDRELAARPPGADSKKDGGAAATDAAAASSTTSGPAPEHERALVPASKTVLSALEALEPFKSRRTLGAVDAEQLRAMGLASPTRTLMITTAGQQHVTLEVGDSSYGAQGRYARIAGSDVVHLIDPAIVSGLEGGVDTLMEKRVVVDEPEQIAGFRVASGERNAAFVQVDRDQPTRRFFAAAEEPTSKSEPAGKLMTTLRNLRGGKPVADDVAARLGAVVVRAEVTLVADAAARAPLRIELVERGDGGGHVVRSGTVAMELSATQAKELLDDVESVFAK